MFSSKNSQSYVSENLNELTVDMTKDSLRRLAGVQAGTIRSTLDGAFDAARNMARSFEVAVSTAASENTPPEHRRVQLNAILLNVLKDNPGFNGTYSAWEPNALDGADSAYRNNKGMGSDATGRFLPYWTRDAGGKIALQPLVEYDSSDLHANGIMKGGWYIGPSKTGKESILAPLPYIVQGKNVFLATMSVPVMVDGKFMGVAGADFELGFVQALAERVKGSVYDGKASVDIITSDGLVIASSEHPELIGKSFKGATSMADQAIEAAKRATDEVLSDTDNFAAFAPIPLGRTDKPWSVIVTVPKTVALAQANALNSALSDRNSADFVKQLVVGILIALGGTIAMWFVARSIATPIARMTNAMKSLANGDLETDVPGKDRIDEIGGMASAVEVFRANAIANRSLEAQTETQRQEAEASRERAAETDRQTAARTLQATNALAEGLKHLADGNLGYRIDAPLASEFETLRSDFNRAVGQLAGTLSTVAQAALTIDSGSREISIGADDLSKRTEQQAASLEETAAALDEITSNVTSSTQRAEEARSVAVKANQNATQSSEVVANAVNAMHRIETASGQIANIISVIDEIAFQTNLLALNAGVEAARAGEAGKGFAVVAQEVRELAQRSAKAAKEIKDLIEHSTHEVENGVKLVTDTGNALKTIVDHVADINQHMEAIATSAREQSVGLSEVNTAVNQMDQVTQQNAAMVEETNAASAALAKESTMLRQLISQFQLEQANRMARTTAPENARLSA
nr:methyl-accepting chemotaxis protein [Rhizobium sp. L1K21]